MPLRVRLSEGLGITHHRPLNNLLTFLVKARANNGETELLDHTCRCVILRVNLCDDVVRACTEGDVDELPDRLSCGALTSRLWRDGVTNLDSPAARRDLESAPTNDSIVDLANDEVRTRPDSGAGKLRRLRRGCGGARD